MPLGLAFSICLGRQPTPEEKQRLKVLLSEFRSSLIGDHLAAQQIAGAVNAADTPSLNEQAAWVMLSRVLMNLDSFFCRE